MSPPHKSFKAREVIATFGATLCLQGTSCLRVPGKRDTAQALSVTYRISLPRVDGSKGKHANQWPMEAGAWPRTKRRGGQRRRPSGLWGAWQNMNMKFLCQVSKRSSHHVQNIWYECSNLGIPFVDHFDPHYIQIYGPGCW